MLNLDFPLPPSPHPPDSFLIDSWLKGGSHIYVDTKKGMTLGNGVWPVEGPLTLIERHTGKGVLDLPFMQFAASVYDDFRNRRLFSDEAQSPDFDPLAMFNGKNAWSPMHDVWGALLDDLDRIGVKWAADALLRVACSWAKNSRWGKYFIMTDNPLIPYQDAGRLRTAASVVSVLFHLCRVLRRKAKAGDGMAGSYLMTASHALRMHLRRIRDHLPLTAKAQGDHLPVPHVEVFMAGLLFDVVGKCAREGIEPDVCEEIRIKMREIVDFARLPQFGPNVYAYDVAIDGDGKFYFHDLTLEPLTGDEEKDKIIRLRRPEGIGSVNSWIVRAASEQNRFPLIEDAKAKKWPEQNPMYWLAYCGSV